MELYLRQKRVFITGGSRGIGLAVAKRFAEEGCKVAIGARTKEKVEEKSKKIAEDYGVETLGIVIDVTNIEDIQKAKNTILKHFKGLDILINNAGTGSEETIVESKDEKWYYFWDLHVMSAVRLSREFIPIMKENKDGGVILNTASICAKQPLWYEPIYNTTKAALVMFGKCLANEAIKYNIRVNTVNPGLVLTPDWWKTAEILSKKEGISPKDYLDNIAKKFTPIKRFATPEEIADLYVYLASPRASYCVGSTYYIDGGWLNVVD